MNPTPRMYRTLGCLAVAMTFASALLGWMDPSVDLPEEVLSTDQLLARVNTLVKDNVDIHRNRWVDVEILSGPSVLSTGRLLTASADTDRLHFYIDAYGQVYRGSPWRYQTASNEQPNTVRIRVSSRGEGQPMSIAQWAGVRALISVLNEMVADPHATLPIYLEDTWSDIYRLDRGTAIQIAPLTPTPPADE